MCNFKRFEGGPFLSFRGGGEQPSHGPEFCHRVLLLNTAGRVLGLTFKAFRAPRSGRASQKLELLVFYAFSQQPSLVLTENCLSNLFQKS